MVRKLYLSVLTVLFFAFNLFAASQGEIKPAEMANWQIYVDDSASPSEVYAAHEFADLFKEAVGINLPIVQKSDNYSKCIFIGKVKQ